MNPGDAERRDAERCQQEPWPFSWTVPVETPASRWHRERAQRSTGTPDLTAVPADPDMTTVRQRWAREIRRNREIGWWD